ncbi:tectonic-3-like [Nelusetta ayraudi]|uniref:tectonic-3-like n=1 Tax=Nelusetta ayraudi TaxID=303726 RepID=UPI003F6E48EC
MNRLESCLLAQIFIFLCLSATNAATESILNSPSDVSTTSGEAFSPPTPPAGGAAVPDPTSVATTEAVSLSSPEATKMEETETPGVFTETPPAPTAQPVVPAEDCLCDLTPDFCDIGCCCDTVDCAVADLTTVFTGCSQKAMSGVCIEKWLMFRANVDPALVNVTDSLFCIRTKDNVPQPLPALPQLPAVGNSYHFLGSLPTSSSYSRDFYRVDDVILTYFPTSSVRGLLRQPSPGAAAAFCWNRNPAKFLRSGSLSCSRTVTLQSCTADTNLNARSYFSDLSLIKIPVLRTVQVSDLLISVTPLSDWPEPKQQDDSCLNVVKKVEFVISYNGRGELVDATVDVALADVDLGDLLLQTHSVQFKLVAAGQTPKALPPTAGLGVGSPLVARSDGEVKPLTTLAVSHGGECHSDPSWRTPVLFAHNTITGCTTSIPSGNCSEVRARLYEILEGQVAPDELAMNGGSQLEWTRVIRQRCPISPQESCESGCVLPSSLLVQVLWARLGHLDLPQNYILGAKYVFQCQKYKCSPPSPITVTTEVTFVDTTVYPDPPRGAPQPQWKFPFGFFTRGTAELDGHTVFTSSGAEEVTWSLMLFTVMLLTGLEFFTR